MRDLAIVMVYWNPAFSTRLLQNLKIVCTALEKTDAPYWIGEVAFEERPFELDGPRVLQWRSSSYMFYKENVFMRIVEMLPPEITKVMLLDADILFDRPDWYDATSKLLDRVDVCQPYSRAFCLGRDGSTELTKTAITSQALGHPGYAWAFRRDWLAQNPLCEHCVVGAGDGMLAVRLGLAPSSICPFSLTLSLMSRYPRVRVGHLDGTIRHLFHGTGSNRQYVSRHTEFKKAFGSAAYDTFVERRTDGLLGWIAPKREAINSIMIRYFVGRGD